MRKKSERPRGRPPKPKPTASSGADSDEQKSDIPIGYTLQVLRLFRGLSIRELAKKAGIGHTTLGEIELGRRPLTEKTLDKLAAKSALRLSPPLIQSLRDAAEHSQPNSSDPHAATFLPPALPVSTKKCLEREKQEDIAEVWVVAGELCETDDAEWRGEIAANILRGCRYFYFLPKVGLWSRLRASLGLVLDDEVITANLTVVILPPRLWQLLGVFPALALMKTKKGAWLGYYGIGEAPSAPLLTCVVMPAKAVDAARQELEALVASLCHERTVVLESETVSAANLPKPARFQPIQQR